MFWRLGDVGSGAAVGDQVTCVFVNAFPGGVCGVGSSSDAIRGLLGFAEGGKFKRGVGFVLEVDELSGDTPLN